MSQHKTLIATITRQLQQSYVATLSTYITTESKKKAQNHVAIETASYNKSYGTKMTTMLRHNFLCRDIIFYVETKQSTVRFSFSFMCTWLLENRERPIIRTYFPCFSHNFTSCININSFACTINIEKMSIFT